MRTVEFPPNGNRIRVPALTLVEEWRKHTSEIPAQYALGTAQHESDFTYNEVDTEPNGFVSKGIFQLSDEEARDAFAPNANLLDYHDACLVFARISEERLHRIILAAKLTAPLPPAVWAYLALAHNQGLHACEKSILTHGLNWEAYKARNPDIKGIAEYGDDCVSGGSKWELAWIWP